MNLFLSYIFFLEGIEVALVTLVSGHPLVYAPVPACVVTRTQPPPLSLRYRTLVMGGIDYNIVQILSVFDTVNRYVV